MNCSGCDWEIWRNESGEWRDSGNGADCDETPSGVHEPREQSEVTAEYVELQFAGPLPRPVHAPAMEAVWRSIERAHIAEWERRHALSPAHLAREDAERLVEQQRHIAARQEQQAQFDTAYGVWWRRVRRRLALAVAPSLPRIEPCSVCGQAHVEIEQRALDDYDW